MDGQPAIPQTQKFSAKHFIDRLIQLQPTAKSDNSKNFKGYDLSNRILNIRMLKVFELAKEYSKMSLNEIDKLLDSDFYEARLAAVCIMDFQARSKTISNEKRKQLFDLYIGRHDRINTWDMVDRSAPYVVGGYLMDKSRSILYKLAKSRDVWERRTAIVSTYFFIRRDEVADTFKIAEILVNDKHEFINKAVGSWIREAGKKDQQKLLDFLDVHAATMPRVTLRYAVEKLDKRLKEVYMNAK